MLRESYRLAINRNFVITVRFLCYVVVKNMKLSMSKKLNYFEGG